MSVSDRYKYNCPNCSAPIGYTEICQYCGTRLKWQPYEYHVKVVTDYIKWERVEASAQVENAIPPEIQDKVAFKILVERLAEGVARRVQIYKQRNPVIDSTDYKARVIFADVSTKNDNEAKLADLRRII